jgi:hypothetical protein
MAARKYVVIAAVDNSMPCLLQGLEMLIRDFGYHIMYKRWNDTFTAVPFKPK